MPDTRWCPRCGAEYRSEFTTCADCGVALVGEPPALNPTSESEPIGGDEPFVYDLTEWPVEWRDSLQWMLGGRNIPFQWESDGMLVVPSGTEETVDDFIEYIASGDPDVENPEDARELGTDEPVELSIEDFYDADPLRRASEEVGFGIDWTDADGYRYALSWICDTGELFLMGGDAPRVRDLIQLGIEGPPVEVVATISGRDTVEEALAGWQESMLASNSVEWVRQRVAGAQPQIPGDAPSRATDDESMLEQVLDDRALADGWWTPPAAIGWVASDLDDLAARYSELRSEVGPDGAMAKAIGDVLEAGSAERLTEFFAGEKDVVYGTGAGASARTEMRDALEARRLSGP